MNLIPLHLNFTAELCSVSQTQFYPIQDHEERWWWQISCDSNLKKKSFFWKIRFDNANVSANEICFINISKLANLNNFINPESTQNGYLQYFTIKNET